MEAIHFFWSKNTKRKLASPGRSAGFKIQPHHHHHLADAATTYQRVRGSPGRSSLALGYPATETRAFEAPRAGALALKNCRPLRSELLQQQVPKLAKETRETKAPPPSSCAPKPFRTSEQTAILPHSRMGPGALKAQRQRNPAASPKIGGTKKVPTDHKGPALWRPQGQVGRYLSCQPLLAYQVDSRATSSQAPLVAPPSRGRSNPTDLQPGVPGCARIPMKAAFGSQTFGGIRWAFSGVWGSAFQVDQPKRSRLK